LIDGTRRASAGSSEPFLIAGGLDKDQNRKAAGTDKPVLPPSTEKADAPAPKAGKR